MYCPCDCFGCAGERCSGISGCHYQVKCIQRPFARKEEPVDWDKQGFRMLDASWLAVKYPSTFRVPNAVAKDALRPNDFVKIFFEDQMMPEFPERLWVQVSTWDLTYGGVGRIANVPYCIAATYGETVKFKKENILAIMKREEYNALGGLQVPAIIPAPRLALTAKVED